MACAIQLCLKSRASILVQLGSLCKGLVRVGGQLERNNPYALNQLQVLAATGNLQFNCDGRSSSIYELFFVGFVDQPLPRLQLGHCSEAPDS